MPIQPSNCRIEKKEAAIAGSAPEAQAHVFVDAGDPEPAVYGEKEQNHQRRGQQSSRQPHNQSGVLLVGHLRRTQVGDGAQNAGDHAEADREPRHPPVGQEVGPGVLLLAGKAQGQADHNREVAHQDQGV